MSSVEFAGSPSASLLCPVCQDVMTDPVITRGCSHSFCAACIQLSLANDKACPLCRGPFSLDDLHQNLALEAVILELPVFCAFRSFGCDVVVRLDQKKAHEKGCGHAPKKCPNASRGCRHEGPAKELEAHLKLCPFQQLRAYLDTLEKNVANLSELVKNQARELSMLKNLLVNQNFTANSGLFSPQIQSPGVPSESSLIGSEAAKSVTWPFGDLSCKVTLSQSNTGVTALAYYNNWLFSGGHDGITRMWDLEKGTLLSTFVGHQYTVWSLAFQPEKSRLFSASSDYGIKVWNVTDPQAAPVTLNSHSGRIFCLLLHANRCFSASSDRTVKVWDLDSLECTTTLEGHTEGVNAIVAVDAHTIASGSNDLCVKIWDLRTYSCTRTVQSHSEVLNLAFGMGYLFCSSYDSKIYVYDLEQDWSLAKTLQGHRWEVWQLVFVDGALFSGSFDHTIKRWTVTRDGIECSATLSGHKGYVHAMVVGHNCLITGCADKTIKIWR